MQQERGTGFAGTRARAMFFTNICIKFRTVVNYCQFMGKIAYFLIEEPYDN